MISFLGFAFPSLVAVSALSLAAQETATKQAFLIGVASYSHPKLKSLRYSERDVVEMATVLRAYGYQVTVLSDGSATKPTKANLDARLRRQ